MKKKYKIIFMIIAIIIIILIFIALFLNFIVISSTKESIISEEEATKKQFDCILILGAGVWGNKPSPMLEDRLLEGISLYEKGASNKIIMSGDHSRADYDEVNVMKKFAMDKGIKSEDIFMDHAGLSTYDSLYRAKEIFEANKILIVTQEYHLPRALYIAKQLGIEAYGVKADPRKYAGQTMRNLREILARDKDFIMCIIKPKSTFLGEKIPITGDGNVTNDKKLD